MSVTTERKRAIIESKLTFHGEAYYSYEIDAKVAKDVGIEKMLVAAIDGMKKTQGIISGLEAILDTLPQSEQSEDDP